MIYISLSSTSLLSINSLSSVKKILVFLFLSVIRLCVCVCLYVRACAHVCIFLRSELRGIFHSSGNSDWFRHKKVTQFGPMRVRSSLLLLYWEASNILFLSLRTNSSQLSKPVKHFHTSVLLQMLFHFLNEWRNPSVFPYVILAWVAKPYSIIFNLISTYSLLFYQTTGCLIIKHSSFFSVNSPLTFLFVIPKLNLGGTDSSLDERP